jgi:hypothetical protein
MTPDWRAALRQAGKAGQAGRFQGEMLNFESPGAFFGRLNERRLPTADQPAIHHIPVLQLGADPTCASTTASARATRSRTR